ncbi:hypothetical protein PGT21_004167 [Puccinia graminis f. sp. tritici]|uniref:Thiamine pyrophosphokinase n=1 Tax=Puccinia graminis f. sp. tritici TaxID=56615 RepID=A0A5B0RXK4_PUCGR|nr:hypothetical protein PGT21_004167 [Puccinia graminis f. sp. tritici]KAA1130681.1 hypothetical protein PGTUg99_023806 [Puccinia graminis f. sp. tritici]
MAERRWDGPFNRSTSISRKSKTYLIILNTPIKIARNGHPNQVFEDLWKLSDYRICADGGANRLHDYCSALGEARKMLIPDYIKGDLDSIRPEVKQFYEHSGSQITRDPDQDSTDFGKCLALIEGLERQSDSNDYYNHSTGLLLIHGGLTGRLDQTIHTLHTLLARLCPSPTSSSNLSQGVPETWVVDTDAGSMACALEREMKHLLVIPPSWRQGPSPLTCGILPIGINQATVTTKGLKWNLSQAKTSITGLLSTSNHILPETDAVEVMSDERVIWTIEIPGMTV